MTKEQLQRECDYANAMAIADKLLSKGYISKEEYIKIHRLFIRKFAPIIAGGEENPKSLT